MFQSVWSIFEKKLQCRVWCIHVAMKFLKRKGKEFCLNIFEVILGAFKVDPFLTLYYSANSLQSFYKSPTTDFISLLVCQASKCYFRDRVSYLRDHEKFCFLLIELQMKEGPFSAYFSHFGFAVVGTVLASSLHHFIQKINRLIDTWGSSNFLQNRIAHAFFILLGTPQIYTEKRKLTKASEKLGTCLESRP